MGNTTRIPIDIESARENSLAGNSFYSLEFLSTADEDMGFWQFVFDVDGKINGKVTIPNVIGATPNAKIILIIAADATTGDTLLNVNATPVANDAGQLNTAKTAGTEQLISVPGTAFLTKEVTFTLPTTGAFPVVAKDILEIEIFHEGTSTSPNDTLATNTLLKEAYLEIDLS